MFRTFSLFSMELFNRLIHQNQNFQSSKLLFLDDNDPLISTWSVTSSWTSLRLHLIWCMKIILDLILRRSASYIYRNRQTRKGVHYLAVSVSRTHLKDYWLFCPNVFTGCQRSQGPREIFWIELPRAAFSDWDQIIHVDHSIVILFRVSELKVFYHFKW